MFVNYRELICTHNTLNAHNTRMKLTTMANIQSKTKTNSNSKTNRTIANIPLCFQVAKSRVYLVSFIPTLPATRNLYIRIYCLSSSSFVYTSRICKWILFIFPDSIFRPRTAQKYISVMHSYSQLRRCLEFSRSDFRTLVQIFATEARATCFFSHA